MSSPRKPSPASSQATTMHIRRKSRQTRSVCSDTSNTSARLTDLVLDSFRSSLTNRQSILNDDTNIEVPSRKSWWKQLGDNSRDVTEITQEAENQELLLNNIALEYDAEISRYLEKENLSIDLQESSDGESIHSIVLPQRKLLVNQNIRPKKKTQHIINNEETLATTRTSYFEQDIDIDIVPKKLFNQPSKQRAKSLYRASLFNTSANKTVMQNVETPVTNSSSLYLSESESIHSIVIPQRKLFTNQDNRVLKKFKQTNNKNDNIQQSLVGHDKDIDIIQTKLFNQTSKAKTKPDSPIQTSSSNKSFTKTIEIPTPEITRQDRNLFGNRAGTKQKINKFAEFILKENEDEIAEQASNAKTKPDPPIQNSSPNKSFAETIETPTPEIKRQDRNLFGNRVDTKQKTNKFTDFILRDSEDEIADRASNAKTKPNPPIQNSSPNKSFANIETPTPEITGQVRNLFGNRADTKKNTNKFADFILRDSEDEIADHASKAKKKSGSPIQTSSPNKSFTKTIEIPTPEITGQVRNLFGNRPGTKQKTNKFADFILTDSEDEITEIQPRLSGFQKKTDHKHRKSTTSQLTSSTTDEEMDEDWQLLPSSTMIENQFNSNRRTPLKETKLSKVVCPDKSEFNLMNKSNHLNKTRKSSISSNRITNPSNLVTPVEVAGPVVSNVQDKVEIINKSQSSKSAQEYVEIVTKIGNEENEKTLIQEIPEIDDSGDDENFTLEYENDDEQIFEGNFNATTENKDTENGLTENLVTRKRKSNKEDDMQIDEEQGNPEKTQNERIMEKRTCLENQIKQEKQFQHDKENEMNVIDENKEIPVYLKEKDNEEENKNQAEYESDNEAQENNAMEESDILNNDVDSEEENESDNNEDPENIENDVENDISTLTSIQRNSNTDIQIDDLQNEIVEEDEQSENNEQNKSDAKIYEKIDSDEHHANISTEDDTDNEQMDCDPASDHEISENKDENIDANQSLDKAHDSTNKSLEAVRDKTHGEEPFTGRGRNTSFNKSKTMIKQLDIHPSLAPARESTGFSDGIVNSSADGSVWDSHRTTRKTLRQTFGKDFTPRKSLRSLVMERAAKRETKLKRQTNFDELASDTIKMPLANSTEFESYRDPEPLQVDETVEESDHEASRQLRQTTLEMYLQKVKQENAVARRKMHEEVLESLKRPPKNIFKMPEIPKSRRPTKTASKTDKSRTKLMPGLISNEALPQEFLDDLKYKPPKRFQGKNAPWITKRLYKYLEEKLEPKYSYRARIRAEKLVETLYEFVKVVRKCVRAGPPDLIANLQVEMARLGIVTTYYDFYCFFHKFMPREVRIRVNPDIMNKIPGPEKVFANILPDEYD